MCRYDNGDIMDVDWNLVLDLRDIFVTENLYKLFIHYDITVWFYVFSIYIVNHWGSTVIQAVSISIVVYNKLFVYCQHFEDGNMTA